MTYTFADWQNGKPFPKAGWDAADAVADGWSKADLDSFMRATVKPWSPRPELKKNDTPQPAPAPEPEPAPAPEPEPEPMAFAEPEPFPPVHMVEDGGGDLPSGRDRYYPSCIPAGLRREAFEKAPWRDHPLRKWVFLTAENVFYNWENGDTMTKAAFDLAMATETPFQEIETDKGTTLKKLAASKTLVENMAGHVVSNVMYRPDEGDALFFEWEGLRFVNSYLPGSTPEAAKGWQDHDAWRVCRDHIFNILPDGAEKLIEWMAHNVQRPGEKINWSPVIVGAQGAGKTTIADMMKAAMGRRHVQNVGPEALFSDFTGWAEGACVRVLEEIRIPGERRTAVMNKLKPFITNQTVEVVRKGRDGKEILNVTNYLALTNFRDALALDEGDRRWCVWSTRFQSREHVVAETDAAYFNRVYDAIHNHGDVIRAWLMSIDLSNFSRTEPPEMTEAKREMIEFSRSGMDADLREALELGGTGVTDVVVVTDCLNERIKELGGRPLNTSAMANIMRELGWAKLDARVKWDGRARRLYYRADKVPAGMDDAELVRYLRMILDGHIPADPGQEALSIDW